MVSICCLINQRAGAGQGAAVWQGLQQAGQDLGVELRRQDPELVSRAPAAELGWGERVLVAGGDGTVSCLLPRLQQAQRAVALVPVGTANDLAQELGIKRNWWQGSYVRLLEWVLAAPTRDLQLWRIRTPSGESRLFVNYVSFGFDGWAVERYERWRQSCPGAGWAGPWGNRLLFTLAGTSCLFCPKVQGRLVGDTQEIRVTGARTLLFANISSYMGLARPNIGGAATDELLELIELPGLIDYVGLLSRFRFLPQGRVLGRAGAWSWENLDGGGFFQVDGELAGSMPKGSYQIEKAGSLAFLVA